MATNRNGHRLKGHKLKRAQTGTATNRTGHKPERPQTETATNRNGHRPKWPQTETISNWVGKTFNINCIETWSRVYFLANFVFVFANRILVFSVYVCHCGALPFVSGLGLFIIWDSIYLTEPLIHRNVKNSMFDWRVTVVTLAHHIWRRMTMSVCSKQETL